MAAFASTVPQRSKIALKSLCSVSTTAMSGFVVNTEQGKVKGQASRNCNDFPYFTFKGIPYAKPPVGDLRFAATQPPNSWEGIWDATKNCNICAQLCRKTRNFIGDEDCLYLNVYTPQLPATNKKLLPVMVFLHGGGFLFGRGSDDSSHGPDFLIEKGVVMVSINYRLGILGFLSLHLKEAPGNMGLMDQVQALKWIQKNISNFGGNPDNVTLFGASAGGACVGYLMLCPAAKGLFHKAIAQSGCPLLPWAHNRDIMKLASKIPVVNDKYISDRSHLLKYLKSLSASELISSSLKVVATNKFRGGIHFGFVPTVNRTGDFQSFLPKPPYELLAEGAESTRIPYLSGFCTREALLMAALASPTLDKLVKTGNFLDHFPFDINDAEKIDVQRILKRNYLDGKSLYDEPDAFAVDFFTDVDILAGVLMFAKSISQENKNVFLYEFAYDGNLNCNKMSNNIVRKGACHGDELGYILRRQYLAAPISEADAKVRKTMTTMWTDFAKYGNPTPKIDELINTKWEPLDEERTQCLVINETLRMKYEVYPQRMQLFEMLFKKQSASA